MSEISDRTLLVEFHPGSHVNGCIKDLFLECLKTDIPCRGSFNGVDIKAYPSQSMAEVKENFNLRRGQEIQEEADALKATIKEQAAEIERLKASPWISVDDYGLPSDEVTECIVLVRGQYMTHPAKKLDEWCPKSCTFDQWPSELVVEWMPIPPTTNGTT